MERRVLAKRLVDILDLATKHTRLLPKYRLLWGSAEDPFVTLADKILVESAILARVAWHHARNETGVAQAVIRLADQLCPQARSVRNQVLIRRYPHTAMSIGIAHAALSSIGFEDAEFDRLIRSAIASGWTDSTERLSLPRH